MQRRALLQTAAVALLAGCAGGNEPTTSDEAGPDGTGGSDEGKTDATRSPPPTSTEYEHTMITVTQSYNSTTVKPASGSVTGTVVTEGWVAESLAGRIDADASTVAIEGRIRNETESDYWPIAVLIDFFDATGTELASKRAAFDVTVEIIPDDVLTILQTVTLPSTDVTEIETMELDLKMDG